VRKTLLLGGLSLMVAVAAGADSLFNAQAEQERTLISAKKKKFEVGDIITVLVRENIDASTKSDTNTKKESDVEAEAAPADNSFFLAETPGGLNILPEELLPNWKIEMENEHKGTGTTRRTNKLLTTIACVVTKVLDNGNIEIEGEKRVTVNREDSKVYVKGLVRSRDVSPANTVNSTQIANAVITLEGRGPLWNNQRRGILTRILDWFSPF